MEKHESLRTCITSSLAGLAIGCGVGAAILAGLLLDETVNEASLGLTAYSLSAGAPLIGLAAALASGRSSADRIQRILAGLSAAATAQFAATLLVVFPAFLWLDRTWWWWWWWGDAPGDALWFLIPAMIVGAVAPLFLEPADG